MRALIRIAALCMVSHYAAAQAPDECQDMVKLRDRSTALDLALGKIDTGGKISVTQNADFTSQLMTTVLFENYMCRLNQVLTARGQAPIPPETTAAWMEEINSAYRTYDEATDGKLPGALKPSFNKARDTVTATWGQGSAKSQAYQARLPVNVGAAFQTAVPKIDLTSNVSGSAYLKTVVGKGLGGNYESTIAKGEALVGDQLFVLQNMRTSVGLYAAGATPAAGMLRDIIKGVGSALSQINSRRSEALLREQMRIDAEAKAREALQSTASQQIAELEKRLTDVEQKLKAN